jgi:hypothetical protein
MTVGSSESIALCHHVDIVPIMLPESIGAPEFTANDDSGVPFRFFCFTSAIAPAWENSLAIFHLGQGLTITNTIGTAIASTMAAHAPAALGPRRRSKRKTALPASVNKKTCTAIHTIAAVVAFMIRAP